MPWLDIYIRKNSVVAKLFTKSSIIAELASHELRARQFRKGLISSHGHQDCVNHLLSLSCVPFFLELPSSSWQPHLQISLTSNETHGPPYLHTHNDRDKTCESRSECALCVRGSIRMRCSTRSIYCADLTLSHPFHSIFSPTPILIRLFYLRPTTHPFLQSPLSPSLSLFHSTSTLLASFD